MKSDRGYLFEQLRQEYPEFSYNECSYKVIDRYLQVKYNYSVGDKYFFSPTHKIPLPENFNQDSINNSLFRKKIFNLGLVEMISYWKAMCSPRIIIKAATLDAEQYKFWKKLFYHGLGEFFHLNGIHPGEDLLEFVCEGQPDEAEISEADAPTGQVLVPIGGGKDSSVTLEVLKGNRKCLPFIMNVRGASLATTRVAGYTEDEIICSSRTIDPQLLDLNDKGYLNGHTPFSAVLAFTGLVVASLHRCSEIALSNESSANEPSIPGTKINHQYSKSLEFENDFREYVAKYVDKNIEYYSFLRPLNELQIGGLFSGFPAHHQSFRSCNVGSKTDTWCGRCPKCLFTFIILSPFIDYKKLCSIFGKDLLMDISLSHTLDQLCGIDDEKPFECVGTIEEVNLAMQLLLRNFDDEKPALLLHYLNKYGALSEDLDRNINIALQQFDENNIPSAKNVSLLKKCIHEISY